MKKILFVIFFSTIFVYVNAASATEPAIINSVTDSLGNVQTNSWGTGGGGGWPSGVVTPVTVTVGADITFTVDATDPGDGTLQYKFIVDSTNGGYVTKQDWSLSNTWTWAVGQSEYGQDTRVTIAVRNDDGHDYLGTEVGDDYTYATYNVDATSYTITPEVIGENGDISPTVPQSVPQGDATRHTFTFTPDTGYSINSVYVTCNGTLSGNTFIAAALTDDCNIAVAFEISIPGDFDGDGKVDLIDAIRALQVSSGQ